MQSFQTLVYVLLAVAALAFAYTLWRGRSVSTAVVKRPDAGRRNATESGAEQVLQTVKRLQAENAQWPAILRALNPANDARIAITLNELRGPHMFVPHTALAVIEAACLSSKGNPRIATAHQVLVVARESMEKVTRYGD